ncbi:hypothetical protein D7Y23_29820 [Corallococcus sp. AB050B]|nr:hypothetical protein D7Y23_29820 [Corallococcus sp. AB050B]
MTKWSGEWIRSRAYTATDDSTRRIIRKTVSGGAYNVTLDMRNKAEALAELASFLRNPVAYHRNARTRPSRTLRRQCS